MERIAIIDLGSNSIRFVIMQIGAHGSYKLVYQEKKSIRLAEGMTLDSRQLTEEAQQRALQCLTVYAHIMAVQKVKKNPGRRHCRRQKCSERRFLSETGPSQYRHSHDHYQRKSRSGPGFFRRSPHH